MVKIHHFTHYNIANIAGPIGTTTISDVLENYELFKFPDRRWQNVLRSLASGHCDR